MTLPFGAVARSVPAYLRGGVGAWWMVLAGLCLVLLAPLLVVDVPPLLDYPNHLGRLFVLASLPDDPVLARFYAPRWSMIPNLGLDLAGPPLIRLLGVHVAGRVLIGVAVLLPVLGAVAYHTSLNRSRGDGWWPLGVGLAAYNNCLLYGFLNFSISVGLGLMLAAGWLRWREDRPAVAIGLAVAGAPVLFVCHLMGLVFFGVLIGSAALSGLSRLRGGALVRAAIVEAGVAVLVFAVPAGLYFGTALQSLGGDAAFAEPGEKLRQLVAVFSGYSVALDAAAVLVAVGVPAISLVFGKGTLPGPAAVAIVVLLVIYWAAPSGWKGTFSLDVRFAVMLGFMVFGGFVPGRWPLMARRGVAGGVMVLFLARIGLLTAAWAAHDSDLADLRRVLQPVAPGQAVYVAEAGVQEAAPGYWGRNPGWRLMPDGSRLEDHLGALVLIEHRAYWPFEFDVPSQQPIETREPYRTLAERIGHIPSRGEAAVADVCGFDYVLLLAADSVPDLPVERFRLLSRSGFAALYAITRCQGGE